MSQYIPLKANTTVTGVMQPHYDLDLDADTQVLYDRITLANGILHVITYDDGGELYQAFKFDVSDSANDRVPTAADLERQEQARNEAEREAAYESEIVHNDDDNPFTQNIAPESSQEPPDEDNPFTQGAPVAVQTTLPDLGARELVLYRSKAGSLARYRVVHRRRNLITLNPADWIGENFTVRRGSTSHLPPGLAPTDDN